MSNELTNYQPGAVELTMARAPQVVLREAEQAASALMELVEKRKLYQQIGTRKHLYVEAWETIGHFYGVHVRTVRVMPIQIGADHGFEATAEACHAETGMVLASASALCMTDEDSWRNRQGKPVTHKDRYAMAQTRARSRAYRSLFDFVAQIAGYEGTTGEDIGDRKPPVQQPQRKPAGPGVISEAQRKRLYAMSKKAAWTNEEMHALLAEFGYESSNDVEKKNYEAICSRVEAGDKPTTQNTTSNEAEKSEAGQWRLHFTAADQPKIEAWLKGEHKLTGDDAIDKFFKDTWQDDPSDALDAAQHWLGKQPSQGNLGV
jgi:hypothetical protein